MKRLPLALMLILLSFCLYDEVLAQNEKLPVDRNKTSLNKNIPCDENPDSRVKNSDVDIPIKIINKPRAAWTPEAARAAQLQGTVGLLVTFLDCGKIGAIETIISMPYGLNESAAEAARKIAFNPARKGGKPVTTRKLILYPFTLY